MERMSDTPAKRDPTPKKNVTKRGIARTRRAIESPLAENLNPRNTVTRLVWMEVLPMMTATIRLIGRIEAVAAKQEPLTSIPTR